MKAADALFLFFALLTVIPAILMVTVTKNIVRAAFLLLLTFWGVAGLYALLGADFLMAAQLIVYVGGILVLILFGVMLSRRMTMAELPIGGGSVLMGGAGALALLFFIVDLLRKATWTASAGPLESPTIDEIGGLFLGQFLLPFEFISVLLLGALIGAVVLARKEFDDRGEEDTENLR